MRILVACYTILAIAATSRATVQLATRATDAPVPYALSALAAVVYLALAFSLRRGGRWRTVAFVAALAELIGVLTVGVVELVRPEVWPDQTVWSGFGIGYTYAPLLLPLIAIALLSQGQRFPPPSVATALCKPTIATAICKPLLAE